MENSPTIGLCGWSAGQFMDEMLTSIASEKVSIGWAILDRPSPSRFTQKIFVEDDILAIIGGRTKQEQWTLSLEELSAFDHKLPLILRVQERWLIGHWNIDDRLFIVHNSIDYFYKFLKDNPVDIIYHSTASPHHFFNTVFTVVAESMGIKSVFINYSFVTDRFNFIEGINKHPVEISFSKGEVKLYEEYLDSMTAEDFRPGYIKSYYNFQGTSFFYFLIVEFPMFVMRSIYNTTFRERLGLRLYRGKSTLRTGLELIIDRLRSALEIIRLRSFYVNHAESDVSADSIVYFANYQPEATSHPDGGDYPDLRYFFSSMLSQGKKVYFKEHPAIFNYSLGGVPTDIVRHRSLKFYQDILNLGVKFIKPDVMNTYVFKRANLVFSLTGTVSMEAALKSVRSYVAGSPWYGNLPGIIKIHPSDKRFPEGQDATRADFINHFKKIDECSMDNVLGIASGVPKGHVTPKDFGKAISQIAFKFFNKNK